MRCFFRLIAIMPALFFYTVFSVPLNLANRNDIQQRQIEVVEPSRQQHDLLLQLNQLQTTMSPVGGSNAGYCFSTKEIHYHNSSLLGERDKNRLNKNYINRCINVNNINQLVYNDSNKYIRLSYITNWAIPL
ncbi:POTRA domain-containing protein [Pectobacterium carotovorum]|uniref:POTRA domain-containing protein n=1 Tax=Pectobacterium carotovorum TaxID=554 RepID=UPI0029DB84A7|nr:POTRA domain-containing protein [Pectobacterium carotovorum]MDX6914702.1 POTRA domain-containing protein [Pectobacterium carotovorum]